MVVVVRYVAQDQTLASKIAMQGLPWNSNDDAMEQRLYFPSPLFFGCIVLILCRSDLGKHISLPPTRRQMLLVLTKKREHTVISQNSSSLPIDLQICSLISPQSERRLNYILHPKKVQNVPNFRSYLCSLLIKRSGYYTVE